MTNDEIMRNMFALNFFADVKSETHLCDDKDVQNAIKAHSVAAMLALKKRIPEKPQLVRSFLLGNTYCCPSCNRPFDIALMDASEEFCSECGQAIDWADVL